MCHSDWSRGLSSIIRAAPPSKDYLYILLSVFSQFVMHAWMAECSDRCNDLSLFLLLSSELEELLKCVDSE